MSRRAIIWLLGALLAVFIVPLVAIGTIGGTAAGTRWLFDTAKPLLPAELYVGSVDGTLFRGLVIRDIRFEGLIAVDRVDADLAFWALPARRVVFTKLLIDGVDVTLAASDDETTESSGVPDTSLPVAIELPDVQVTDIHVAGAELDRTIDGVQIAASFKDRWLDVGRLSVQSPWLELDGAGRLHIADDLDAEASLTWGFVPPTNEELTGRLSLDGMRNSYSIEHQLTAPADIRTLGEIRLDPDLRIDLESSWDEWRLPIPDNVVIARAGSLRTAGPLADLGVEFDGNVSIEDLPELGLELAGNTDLASATIDSFSVMTDGAELVVEGTADWSAQPSGRLRYQLNIEPDRLLDAAPPGQLELAGLVDAQLEDAGPAISISIEQVSGTLNQQPVTGTASLNIAPGGLEIPAADIGIGDNRLSLSGTAGETLDMNANVEFEALSQLEASLAGRIDGSIRLTGSRLKPAFIVGLNGTDLAVGDNRVGQALFGVEFADPDNVRTRLIMADVHAGSLVFEAIELEQTGGADSHQLRFSGTHETGSFAITGDGAYREPDWRGAIRTARFRTEALSDWSLPEPAEISLTAGSVNVSPFCLGSDDGLGRVCGELTSNADSELAGRIEIRRFPLAAAPVALPGDARLAGFLEAMFDIERTADSLAAKGSAETVDATIESVLDGEPYVTTIDSARVGIDIAESRLFANLGIQLDAGGGELNADLAVDDVMSAESPLDGELIVDVPDLAAVAFLFPDIANPAGRLDARSRINGNRLEPRIESRANVRDASFDVLPAGIRVTDVSLSATQRDLESVSILGSARSGGGELTIEGDSRLSTDGAWSAEVRLSGSDFELLRLPDWDVAASPDVRVSFVDDLTRVRGTLNIPRARISVKTVPETATTPSNDVIVHGADNNGAVARRRYDVDLTAGLGDAVSFSGFGLGTDITGELRIAGTEATPFAGTGRLELRDGRYQAYGQNLVIERGTLTFNGPLDSPQLDVRATRPIANADIVAGIRITGTPQNLRSDVFSEPSMSDAEALSYVLTGRPLTGGQSTSDADLLNKAAFALGLSKAGSVAAQIRAGLGLDTLEVDGGASEGRIVAGKRIGDRLLVEYGYGLVDKLGTLLLRYQLTSRIILESRTGSMSSLDVVYSVKRE